MDISTAKTETTTSIKSSHSEYFSPFQREPETKSLAAAGEGGRRSEGGREGRQPERQVKWVSVSDC